MPSAPTSRSRSRPAPALELLIGLSAATSPPRSDATRAGSRAPDAGHPSSASAIVRVGERSGEAWLHLLGLALELPAEDAGIVRRGPRRAWTLWSCGATSSASTCPRGWASSGRHARARGARRCRSDRHAARAPALLRRSRGRGAPHAPLRPVAEGDEAAPDSGLRLFAEEAFAPERDRRSWPRSSASGGRRARPCRRRSRPQALIASVTRGYVYEPEPEFERVVLVPHVCRATAPPPLPAPRRASHLLPGLAASSSTRRSRSADETVRLGRALGDGRRVPILRRLASGDATLDELAGASGAREVDGPSPSRAAARGRPRHAPRECARVLVRPPPRGPRRRSALGELVQLRASSPARLAKRRSAGRPQKRHSSDERADGELAIMRDVLPNGVELHQLEPHADSRGVFTELFRDSWGLPVEPVQWNAVRSEANVLRGVHAHWQHADYLTVVVGRAAIGLHDLREGSADRGPRRASSSSTPTPRPRSRSRRASRTASTSTSPRCTSTRSATSGTRRTSSAAAGTIPRSTSRGPAPSRSSPSATASSARSARCATPGEQRSQRPRTDEPLA